MNLWLRLGDVSEYEQFGDDFAALALALYDANIKPDDIRPCNGGFTTPYYDAHNWVSLFWGDGDANLIRDLTPDEFGYLRNELYIEWEG